MTGKERFMTALGRGTPDRVPIFLRDITLGLDLCDYDTTEVNAVYDAEKSARAIVASQARFQQDAMVGAVQDLGLDVEPLGGEVLFPRRGVPSVCRHPLSDAADVPRAQRFDPQTAGRWPEVLASYRLVKERLGDRAAVAANIEGPLTRAGLLRGMEKLALDLVDDRALAAQVVELSVQIAVAHVRSLAAAGADFVFIAAASDGPAAFSPRDYMELTIPGLRRIVAAADDCGLPTVFHPHGLFTETRYHDLVEAAIDCGIRGFQLAEGCEVAVARERWGERICILGGPDVSGVLLPGPPEAVAAETRRYLEAGMGEGGFVIMASCSLHRGIPPHHLEAMVATVLRYGAYG